MFTNQERLYYKKRNGNVITDYIIDIDRQKLESVVKELDATCVKKIHTSIDIYANSEEEILDNFKKNNIKGYVVSESPNEASPKCRKFNCTVEHDKYPYLSKLIQLILDMDKFLLYAQEKMQPKVNSVMDKFLDYNSETDEVEGSNLININRLYKTAREGIRLTLMNTKLVKKDEPAKPITESTSLDERFLDELYQQINKVIQK